MGRGRAVCVLALVGLCCTPVADACLNDSDTVRSEDEFRSRYGDAPASASTAVALEPTSIAVIAAAIAVIGASGWQVWRNRRAAGVAVMPSDA